MRRHRGRTFVAAAVVIAIVAAVVYRVRPEALDCESYAFDSASWQTVRAEGRDPDAIAARELADAVVECRLLRRASLGQVNSMLGSPDSRAVERSLQYYVAGAVDAETDGSWLVVRLGADRRVTSARVYRK